MTLSLGYENLTPYVEGLCGQWRPARVDYVARVSKGLQFDTTVPLRICDLACGTGLSVLVQAAATPTHEIVGIDFNPTHIRDARQRSVALGITNAKFINRGVEDLGGIDLGEFDLITMSGAYSWLAPEVRRAVRDFVRRYLKPGGYFGVHAMTQPGWGSIEPLWKIARELAAPGESDAAKRHAATNNLLEQIANSAFMKNHPVAAKRVETIAKLDSTAFSHEYLTAHWRPEYFVDIARVFSEEAGLVYVGDCLNLWRNSNVLSTPRWAGKLLAGIADANIRETVQDYIVLALDRHALFHKGQIPIGEPGRIGNMPLGTLGPFGHKLADGISSGIGKVKFDEERFKVVASTVADRSNTVANILSAPACTKLERKQAAEAIGLLAAGEIIVPFARETIARDVSAMERFNLSAFNRAQLSRPIRSGAWAFASPILGHAIGVGDLDVRFISGFVSAGRAGMEGWLRQQFRGATMNRKDGTKLEGEVLMKHVFGELEQFKNEKFPKLIELEILLPA